MNELKVRKSEKSESPEVGEGRKTQKSGCLKDLSQPQPHSQPQSQPQPQPQPMYPNTITSSIPEFIDETVLKLNNIEDSDWEYKPDPHKWSKKEVLGHLIDSAMTNLRRLVVTQYEPNTKILYRQNEWVGFQQYQHASVEDIITLWKLLNRQYHRTASDLPAESLQLTCDTGSFEPELHTLEFLIRDYWGHQQHHLRQIF